MMKFFFLANPLRHNICRPGRDSHGHTDMGGYPTACSSQGNLNILQRCIDPILSYRETGTRIVSYPTETVFPYLEK